MHWNWTQLHYECIQRRWKKQKVWGKGVLQWWEHIKFGTKSGGSEFWAALWNGHN